jgi:structural maintenance of chromosome 2
MFGKAGTEFAFDQDIIALRAKAEQLENEQKGQKKKVNPKVMTLLEG